MRARAKLESFGGKVRHKRTQLRVDLFDRENTMKPGDYRYSVVVQYDEGPSAVFEFRKRRKAGECIAALTGLDGWADRDEDEDGERDDRGVR